MERTKDTMIELYKKTNCYQSSVLMKNAIQNILDYRLIVGTNVNEFIDKEIGNEAYNLLHENCINSISILNTLASSYSLDLFYSDNLNDKEKIDEFTLDFVMNLCALK